MTDSLVLGAFDLTQAASAGRAGVEASGTTKGGPVPIDVAVKSWLQDGSIVVTQGYDNREVNVRVRLWATTLTALNQAEAALFAEIGEPNLLTWTPSGGPASVFVVVTSALLEDDGGNNADLLEFQRLIRTYNIRLTCEAFVRSATETVTAALAATGTTTTLLDACSATTGWTGFVDGGAVSPATGGGQITLTATLATKGSHTFALQKTFAATTTSTKYLIVRWKPPVGKRFSTLTAIGDGVSLPLIAELPSSVSGYANSYFMVAAASLAVTRVEWTGFADETGSAVLTLDQVDISDVKPIVGTGRQQHRSLVVGGSARAPASLVLESATAALGDAIVYVYDDDDTTITYGPSMRQFRTAGQTVTADATRISGSREPLSGGGVTLQVPVGLFPQGSYHLLGHLSASSSVTAAVGTTTKTYLGGNPLGSSSDSTSVALTTTWTTYVLNKFTLPTVDLPFGSPALMEMSISAPATGSPLWDEFWLLNVDLGSYIRVDCGTGAGTVGGSARRLFIKPPTVAVPRPTIRIGHSADASDSYFPFGAVTSWGFPQFKGGQRVNILAITPGATDAQLSMSNWNRWHTNAGS